MMIKRSVLFTLLFLFSLLFMSSEVRATEVYDFQFSGLVVDDYYQVTTTLYDIDVDATSLFIYFPLIADWFVYSTDTPTADWHYSHIHLDRVAASEDLRLNVATDTIGDYDINALEINLVDVGMDHYDSMQFNLLFKLPNYVSKENHDNEFLEFWSDTFEYVFDDDLENLSGAYVIEYRNQFSIWYQTYYSGVPPIPLEPYSFNQSFIYWRTPLNLQYSFVTPLSPPTYPMPERGIYTLYATYEAKLNSDVDDIGGTGDSIITDVLTLLGMNNEAGKIIMYFILIVLLTAGLVLLRLSVLIVVMINLIVSAFFIFMGWLPMYAIIVIILTMLILLIFAFKKGV